MKLLRSCTFLKLFFGIIIVDINLVKAQDNNLTSADLKEIHDETRYDNENKFKDLIVTEIIKKIGNISVHSLSNVSKADKIKALNKIKKKVEKVVDSLAPPGRGNKYVEIIMNGIKLISMQNRNGRSQKEDISSPDLETSSNNYYTKAERFNNILSLFNNKPKQQVQQEIKTTIEIPAKSEENMFVNRHHRNVSNLLIIKKDSYYNGDISSTPSTTLKTVIQKKCDCNCVVEKICRKIRNVNTLTCDYDNTEIELTKICNGVADCPDRYDEKDCDKHAIESVQNIKKLIKEVEEFPDECFLEDSISNLFNQQKSTLLSVLGSQIKSINSYHDLSNSAREVLSSVNIIAVAFEGTYCGKAPRDISDDEIEDATFFNYNQAMMEGVWAPKYCKCEGYKCVNAFCSESCKRVCGNIYSLNRWSCQSTDKEKSVSLNVICDGKIDCYDETDESDCSTGQSIGKFEAREIFKKILTVLQTKTGSHEYVPAVRALLISLHSCIKDLENLSSDPSIENINLIVFRDKCFDIVRSLYKKIIQNAAGKDEAVEAYNFLTIVKDQLVVALKRSRTGNDRMVAADECYCRNGKCGMSNCSNVCQRACAAESNITRYYCDRNHSVDMNVICNGEPDCINGNDEVNCTSDVCRNHHLKLLSDLIKSAGSKYDGTSMGERLSFWRKKVQAEITLTELNGRPTKKKFNEIIGRALKDLLMTYASIEDNTRKLNYEIVLKKFMKIARAVIEKSKMCLN